MHASMGLPSSASSQPSEYHTHDTPASLSRSPIFGSVWGGILWSAGTLGLCGRETGSTSFTTCPSGVTKPSLGNPDQVALRVEFGCATMSAGAFFQTGVQAQKSQKWLSMDSPNAPAK